MKKKNKLTKGIARAVLFNFFLAEILFIIIITIFSKETLSELWANKTAYIFTNYLIGTIVIAGVSILKGLIIFWCNYRETRTYNHEE